MKVEIGEVLTLKETSKGYYLYIDNLKQKLKIYKGEILNDLTKKQMNFVMGNIKINNMKKLLLILLFIPLFSYGQTIPIDKKLHYFAGASISLLTHIVVVELTHNKTVTTIASIATVFAAGWLREKINKNAGGKFDYNDLRATMIGGFSVTIPIHFIPKKKQKIFMY